MRTNREKMIELLQESLQGNPLVRTTEEFWGEEITNAWKNGIWLCAECGYTYKGENAFGYYNESKQYYAGILKTFEKFLSKHGWHAEWFDPGTIFLFPELHQIP